MSELELCDDMNSVVHGGREHAVPGEAGRSVDEHRRTWRANLTGTEG